MREYLWRQTKYVGYEDSPESISIFADVSEGKARFRFTLENDGKLNKAGDLERHNRLIELPQDTEHHLTYIVGGNNEGTFESLEEDRDEVKRKYEAGIYKKIQINRQLSIDEVTSNEQAITEMRTAVEALLKYYEYVIGFKRKEVYPSLSEYDPGITSEEYERILSDESLVKYDWLDTIYEAFVAQQMAYYFEEADLDVSAQDTGKHLFVEDRREVFSLRPDIVVTNKKKQKIIMDTKWKRLSNNPDINYGISQADMYQMFAYSKKYKTKDIWLLYPVVEELKDHEPIIFMDGEETRVRLFFVNVADIKASMDELLILVNEQFEERENNV